MKTVFKNVDVQRGEITADFRKILQLQSESEKKDRSKHSHHAIDATVLTLIPKAAQRDRMLELFYKIQEIEQAGCNADCERNELKRELRNARIGSAKGLTKFIEENIIIDHITKDSTLSPSKRRKRVRGKIDAKRDNDGNIIFETDENGEFKLDKYGHKIPQAKYYIKGDCIRGQLHQETFYGAIKQPVIEDGVIKRNQDGSVATTGETKYVVRRELKFKKNDQDSGFKTWDELGKAIVDKALFNIMKSQFPENSSFKDAIDQGIFMMKKVGHDWEKTNKIRHVRCFANVSNPIKVKMQTYRSNKEYKQQYYAGMGDLYTMCRYDNEDCSKSHYQVYSLFDISSNRKSGIDDIPTHFFDKKGTEYNFVYSLIKGQEVIIMNGERVAF